jgi:hypothetical protein
MAKAKKDLDQDDNADDHRQAIVAAINAYISATPDSAPVFSPAAGIRMTVKVKGEYKSGKIDADQEFILNGVRAGKRKDLIIEFRPLDSREYDCAEIEDDRLTQLAPNVADWLAEAIGFKGMDWTQAKVKFLSERRRAAAEIAAAEEAKTKAEAESFYDKDPLYGAFA